MKKIKTIQAVAVGVAVILIAGCATTFKPWKLSDVQEGMDKDQVIKSLGEPDSVVTTNGAEHLYYSYQEDLAPVSDVTLEAEGGIDRRVEEFDRTLETSKYEVIIVDGKVVNYKEIQD